MRDIDVLGEGGCKANRRPSYLGRYTAGMPLTEKVRCAERSSREPGLKPSRRDWLGRYINRGWWRHMRTRSSHPPLLRDMNIGWRPTARGIPAGLGGPLSTVNGGLPPATCISVQEPYAETNWMGAHPAFPAGGVSER